MAKKKKGKDRWTLLAETATELNKVLGLEPPIEVKKADEEELEEKLKEASQLITDEDKFTAQTEGILEEFIADEEEAEPEEPEEDEEPEEESEEEEAEPEEEEFEEEDEPEEEEEAEEALQFTPEELIDFVKGLKKRKDLRQFAEESPSVFAPIIEKLPELKSGKALQSAMLKHLESLEEAEEAKEAKPEKETKPKKKGKAKGKSKKEKPKAKGKAKKAEKSGAKSNKEIIYLAWKDGEEDIDTLHKLVEKDVKRNTVRGWVNGWKNGKRLPAIAED